MTDITNGAQNALYAIWRTEGLPELPALAGWSLEYAREVYGLVLSAVSAEVPKEDLVVQLKVMGVWSKDPSEQRWEPGPRKASNET